MIKPQRYLSFLLRLWQVGDAEKPAWRASLESPATGQRQGFASLPELFDFLQAQAGPLPAQGDWSYSMQQPTLNPQAASEATHWQIKWGTLAQVLEAVEVRAYGRLEVSVSNPQQLAAGLGAQNEQEPSEKTRGRLKDMAAQALQAALDKHGLLSFPDHEGACAPECVQQVTADASASLRAQLAGVGLALGSFVIEASSYKHLHKSSDFTGGDDCPGCRAIRIQLGLETPSESSTLGLGGGVMIEAMMQAGKMMQSPASLPPDSMTLGQAAAFLHVTEAEVIGLIESGQLKSEKSGSEYRITQEWLEKYLHA
jgi:excisionase family DNA binding protein